MADVPSRAGVAGQYLTSYTFGPQSFGVSQGVGSAWFGPNAPLQPTAPPDVIGRQFDFPVGYNLNTRPRTYSPISFRDLRELADGYDLLSTVIETRKDQLARMSWSIKGRGVQAKDDGDARVKAITAFFQKPDGVHSWADWLRPLIDDMLVIDAPALYVRRDRGGRIVGLVQVDGATIMPVIDEWGRTPEPVPYAGGPVVLFGSTVVQPDDFAQYNIQVVGGLIYPPAYQQVLKGLPAVDYTTRDLIYRPRNRRVHSPYGRSPVEQIVVTVNIALRRQLSTLNYFTEGNIPDMMIQVPKEWTPDQIVAYQKHWDAYLAGNIGGRRRAKFVPASGGQGGIHETRQQDLKGDFDEWLAKLVCFAFSISPQALTRQMNRACYSFDTETLTENGWRFFEDIKEGERVATFNPLSQKIEYQVPTARHSYDVKCKMRFFKTKGIDVLVTPEHELWLRKENWTAQRKLRAEDIPAGQFYFRASAQFDGAVVATFVLPEVAAIRPQDSYPPKSIAMDDWLEFLGCAIAQGGLSSADGHYLLTLAQRFGRRAEMIDALLDRLPFSSSKYLPSNENCQRWNVYGKQLCLWLRENVGAYSHEKRIPREFLGLCLQQSGILFDALMETDGYWDHRDGRKSGSYATVSKQLADDVQELAFKVGYCASISYTVAHDNKQTLWQVNICERQEHTLRGVGTDRTPSSVDDVSYEGKVYCFNVPNGLFVTRRNGKIGIHGNSADTQREMAEEEGLEPILLWLKAMMDDIIAREFGAPDVEFTWDNDDEVDQAQQLNVLTGYVSKGMMTINEGRDRLGLDPFSNPEAGQPMAFTATGWVPLDQYAQAQEQQATQMQANAEAKARLEANPPNGSQSPARSPTEAGDVEKYSDSQARDDHGRWTSGGDGNQPSAWEKTKAVEIINYTADEFKAEVLSNLSKVAKRSMGGYRQPVPFDRPATGRAEAGIAERLTKAFAAIGAKVRAQLRDAVGKLAKAEPSEEDRARQIADEIATEFDFGPLQDTADGTADDLGDVASDSVSSAVAQIGPSDPGGLVDQVNARAVAAARDRAAEMVGMRWDDDGNLVPSDNPEMAITETTRDELRGMIADALASGTSTDDLADQISESFALSPERASLIAATEVSRANSEAALASYQGAADAGIDVKKAWIVAGGCCDVCEANAAAGPIDLDDEFPSGDDTPPGHPNCRCSLTPVVGEAPDDE